MKCFKCFHTEIEKGRALDGRRAYGCTKCGYLWTNGLQDREQTFSPQRVGYQFRNSKGKQHSIE